MENILFRVDSSSIIGTGHIMRDLVLASQFSSSNIIFAMQELKGNINDKVHESGYCLEILKSNDINEVIELVNKNSIDLIVIDHYGIDYQYEKLLKKKTDVKIMVLADTYEKHYCDILLNHNISASEKKYKGLVPKSCEVRCGIKYTLLREEFYKKQKKRKSKSKYTNIFVGLGGTDPLDLNSKIIKLFQTKGNLNFSIVTTKANPNLIKLKRLAFINKKNVKLYVNINNIAKLMNNCDLAIVTPSVIVHEIMSLKIPFIAIKIAENQNDMFSFLKQKRYKALCKNEVYKLKGLI